MTIQTVYTGPMRKVMVAFMGFTAVAATFAAAEKMGLLEAVVVKRALGFLLGMLVVVIGNFLPKIRPLNAPGANPTKAAAVAERFAGWILVAVGMAFVLLFAIAPLEKARTISSILGIAAMVLIAANWAWLLPGAIFGSRDTSEDAETERARAAKKRKLIISLLFSFFYALATACTVFLLHDRRRIDEVGWWLFLGFWLIYTALTTALECKGIKQTQNHR